MAPVEGRDADVRRAGMPPHPWVYLDHWALRLFSDEIIRGGRMLRVLGGGTLLLSAMNLMEVARTAHGATSLSTVMRILDFLEAVGPRWAILDISHAQVAERERLGDPLPWLQSEWCVRTRRQLGCISLAPLVGRMTKPWAREALEHWEREAAAVLAIVAAARSGVRSKTLDLDGKPIPGATRTEAIFQMMVQRLAKSDLSLNRNGLDDLIHAIVPLAHADVVFLDKRSLGLLRGDGLARKVFDRKRVDDALFHLENAWPPQPGAS